MHTYLRTFDRSIERERERERERALRENFLQINSRIRENYVRSENSVAIIGKRKFGTVASRQEEWPIRKST